MNGSDVHMHTLVLLYLAVMVQLLVSHHVVDLVLNTRGKLVLTPLQHQHEVDVLVNPLGGRHVVFRLASVGQLADPVTDLAVGGWDVLRLLGMDVDNADMVARLPGAAPQDIEDLRQRRVAKRPPSQ